MEEGRFYLDTSAYLGIILGETQAKPLFKMVLKKALCSSTLMLIEAERTLVWLSRKKTLSPDAYHQAMEKLKEDRALFLLRDLTPDLCLTGKFPPTRIPRSSDLLHLRTAQWFLENGGLESFLTLDINQKKAAQEFGLPVP